MKDSYRLTRRCCYLGIMIQALILNVTPLFFVTLRDQFSISFEKIGRLVLITFLVQLLVDFLAVYVVDALGHRRCMIIAEVCAASGLVLFGILPNVLPDAYVGMVMAAIVYSIGAGLSEVMISPIVDALSTEHKASSMTLLHAFYPIGQVLAVLVTTVAVVLFGEGYWPWILMAWAIVPLVNLTLVSRVPFPPMLKGEEKTPLGRLLKKPYFWLMMALMVCAGSSEMAMSQWASLFAEEGLGVSKLLGDLLGPCLFAVCMGIGRIWHGNSGDRIPMRLLLMVCSIATVLCYVLAVFASVPLLALLGCALCGLATSLMWPGVLGVASAHFPKGGTTLFALLALGGDIGCSLGPWITGMVADLTPHGIKAGLIAAAAFPLAMVFLLTVQRRRKAAEE